MSDKKFIHRGCLTDASEARLLCDEDSPSIAEGGSSLCEKCAENGCNVEPKYKNAELACLKCNDSQKCAFGQDDSNRIFCSSSVLFGEEETCYSYTIDDGETVERGCTLDKVNTTSDWCESSDDCIQCFGAGCNKDNMRYYSCARCKGSVNGDCASIENPERFIEDCDDSSYPIEKRGCYTLNHGIVFVLSLLFNKH